MDNFTMLQNAARRQHEGERAGFATMSRVDQADRWAAWQASADMPRENVRDISPNYAASADAPQVEADFTYNTTRATSDEERVTAPEPPKRSFALYNEIVARHNRIFGHG